MTSDNKKGSIKVVPINSNNIKELPIITKPKASKDRIILLESLKSNVKK